MGLYIAIIVCVSNKYYVYWGNNFIVYINVKLVCCIPKDNIVLQLKNKNLECQCTCPSIHFHFCLPWQAELTFWHTPASLPS